MNVLGAATINLINDLKRHLKGWTLTPMVQETEGKLEHGKFATVLRPPKDQSAVDFFIDHTIKESCIIKCKLSKHPLRLLQLRQVDERYCGCFVTYWKANGWRADQKPIGWKLRRYAGPEFDENLEHMRVARIRHVERSSKHQPTTVVRPFFELGKEDSTALIAPTIAAVLLKSFERGYGARRVENYFEELAVKLDGKNFLYDPYRFNFKVVYK